MVLDTIEAALPIAFLTLLSAWLVLSAYMVLERMFYDVTEGKVRRTVAELTSQDLETLEAELDEIPRRMQERVASDLRTPAPVAALIAKKLVEGKGKGVYVERVSARNKWRRIAALHILFHIRDARILEFLEGALRDEDRDVVDAAVSLLGNLPDVRAAQLLVAALTERRFPASRIATHLDEFPEPLSAELLPLLDAPDDAARYWGVTLLSRYGDAPVCEAVCALAHDAHEHVRKAVAQTLGAIGGAAHERAEETLLKLIDDPKFIVRAHAARALAHLGTGGARIAPLLADEEWWVRLAAKESLVSLGDEVIGVVSEYLEHTDRFARNGAAEILQNLGYLDRVLADAVERGADSPEGAVVRRAFEAGGAGMVLTFVARQDEATRARVDDLIASWSE